MMTEETSAAGRYVTLRDYARVIRRYWLIILGLGIIGGALGYVDARRQTPVYSASASVHFTDPSQDLSIVGFGSNSVQTPAQLAAAASATVTQPAVLAAVARKLKDRVPEGALAAISPSVSATSGDLVIATAWSNPSVAALLANAVAEVIAARNNHAARASFNSLAHTIQGQIARLQAQANGKPSARTSGAGTQLLFYDNELARLNTLKQFARTASVATIALPPGAPSSPNKSRSAALGLLLGLLLGVAFAFIRDAMDRRLRNPRAIESSFQFPILGYVRDEAMGRIAYPNGTASRDQQQDIEAFRIVRRNLEFLAGEAVPRSILVTSGLPEEGKTTVAGSLAFAMAATGRRTLLVDCDLRQPALSERLELTRSPGISDFLANRATPEDILRTVEFNSAPSLNGSTPPRDGLAEQPTSHRFVFVPAGSSTSRATEELASARFSEFVAQVSQVYEVVIFDSSPLLPVADTLEMLPHVEAVVICARESKTTRAEVMAAKAALSNLPDRPTGLVITGVKLRREDYYGYSY